MQPMRLWRSYIHFGPRPVISFKSLQFLICHSVEVRLFKQIRLLGIDQRSAWQMALCSASVCVISFICPAIWSWRQR